MRALLKSGSLQVYRKSGGVRPIYMANDPNKVHSDGNVISDLTDNEWEMHKDRLEKLASVEDEEKAVARKVKAKKREQEDAAKLAAAEK